ncbi:MAG: hypothetical protein CML44_01580, partial [Rhodobacteraceae bacterium]|nr:hypothetical protein [Paracoccaceae bacterium]
MKKILLFSFLVLSLIIKGQNPAAFTFSPTNSAATFYGTLQLNGYVADSLDWIAAFDSNGNCAGASQVVVYNGVSYINLVIYGDDPLTPLVDEGMSGSEDFYLKVWDASSDDIFTYQSDTNIVSFNGWVNTNAAPLPNYNDPNVIYNFLYTPVSVTLSDTLFCVTDDPVLLNTGLPVGGTYSGLGVVGVVNNYFNPNGLTQGTYQITYTYNGNSAVINVYVFESSTIHYNAQGCASYLWNTSLYTVSGIYIDSSLNMGGCDSISILNLTITDTSSLTNVTECYPYTWNGITYTTSGVYTFTTANSIGCDSTATLNLIINSSDTASSSLSACDSYSWNGQVITNSGVYTQTLTNTENCDSVHTLTATISYSSSSITVDTSCYSYLWNGITYTVSGNYNFVMTNSSGCDSTAELNLVIGVCGCTDSTAFNYDINANIDDGSCIAVVNGCTDLLAFNYDPAANTDDGSCIASTFGCTDPLAFNYDVNANIDDGSCCLLNQLMQLGNDIDGEGPDDYSGASLSLSSDGNIVAIGALYNNGNGVSSGHTRIYIYNDTSWIQLGQDIDGESSYDYSGWSVSLSSDGGTVAIGAYGDDGNGSNSGHVRVYSYDGSSWNQLGQDIDGEAIGDNSGYSVSLSSDGGIVAIGAHLNDGSSVSSGHTRVYVYNGTSWTQLGQDLDGESSYDYSGWSVSLSADGLTLAICGYLNDGNSFNSGHVRIYSYDGSSWNQLGDDIDGEASYDYSGYSVSLSSDGGTVAIGAPFNDGNGVDAGHVRVYSYDGSSWNQLGGDIDGESAADQSGYSVSLSSDGWTVAIGAPYNDGNGNAKGHVRIYAYNGIYWDQLVNDIDGESSYDYSGHSVSLSSDGNTVAIGAPNNYGNGIDAGHVRVYQIGSNCAGCIDSLASNYDSMAQYSDSSCIYLGCTDPLAFNYNASASIDDGSCIPVVGGCTNPNALNYNPASNTDDGSCVV